MAAATGTILTIITTTMMAAVAGSGDGGGCGSNGNCSNNKNVGDSNMINRMAAGAAMMIMIMTAAAAVAMVVTMAVTMMMVVALAEAASVAATMVRAWLVMSATRRNVAKFCPDRPILATWFLVCRLTFVSGFPDIDGPKTDHSICT